MTSLPYGGLCSLSDAPPQKLLFKLPYEELRPVLQKAQDDFISRYGNDGVKRSCQPMIREFGSASSKKVSVLSILLQIILTTRRNNRTIVTCVKSTWNIKKEPSHVICSPKHTVQRLSGRLERKKKLKIPRKSLRRFASLWIIAMCSVLLARSRSIHNSREFLC